LGFKYEITLTTIIPIRPLSGVPRVAKKSPAIRENKLEKVIEEDNSLYSEIEIESFEFKQDPKSKMFTAVKSDIPTRLSSLKKALVRLSAEQGYGKVELVPKRLYSPRKLSQS